LKEIHFIGIGGIGISGLARYMKKSGYVVSGSDLHESILTQSLEKEGIKINVPHCDSNIQNQDLVVHTSIAKDDNVEILKAKLQGIKTISRKDFLPYIVNDKKVYSVCGAHGKSTTTAILSCIYKDANTIIGAESKSFGSNIRFNQDSEILIFEADESDKSFLNTNAYYAIVTNAEPEHMESYNYDYDYFYQCYRDFISGAKYAVINAEDDFLSQIDDTNITKLHPSKDIKNINFKTIKNEPFVSFELLDYGVFEIWGIGDYIAIDASLAILASLKDYKIEDIRENIKSFRGIKKRFDILKNDELILIDDYGHHPTEIKATLLSAKIYARLRGKEEIVSIWQPHKYSRTVDNIDAFQNSFKDSDRLIILPVWSAGENKIDIDFKNLFKQYNLIFADRISVSGDEVLIIKNDEVIDKISKGLVIGFGAGDITYQLRGAL
jgi:UDP-N-acetylmuramate--alanine ligase